MIATGFKHCKGFHLVRYFYAYNCSSLETSPLDIINHLLFQHVEKQGCMNVDFIPPRSRCEFVVPGNEIPEWVNHKSVGSPSVSAELDPG